MKQSVQTQLAIETRELAKQYDDVVAVDSVDLAIPTNSIYALLGPNGAGKTTTISMLTTLVKPTGGTAAVAGLDVVRRARDVRRHIGVTFQETVLDSDLTGRQILDYHGQLYGQRKGQRQRKIAELLALVELEEAADRRSKTYSGGMKRRLELARGLMTEPDVLFLDEPTQGLDPQNRTKIWDYIRKLRQESYLTVLITTHYMEEAEQLADRVGIMDHGRIMVEGAPRDLIEQMGDDVVQIMGQGDASEFLIKMQSLPFVQHITAANGLIQAGVDSGNRRLVDIVTVATSNGFRVEDISVTKPGLDDVFLKYTGRQLRDK
jgi:ABC-2 type transport system ATP-binding protein